MVNPDPALDDTSRVVDKLSAPIGLAIVRLTIGAMFVWVFFENLGKGGYTQAGYAGVINYYIKASHSPAAWKAIMGFMASHAALAAPMQAMTEILTRSPAPYRSAHTPGSSCGVRVPRQPLGLGVGHLVDSGSCWSRYSPRLPFLSEARVEPGVSTDGWRDAGRPPGGGDLNLGPVRVSVIIPTRNEAQAIGRVLGDLPPDLATEVIVVDNNSTDGTPEIAARMGARVICEARRGYGRPA